MTIRQLPQDVVDKIKSSVNITSLNGVACGLLANSLDAGAFKVNISIDYGRGSCTIEDDGSGIPPDEFKDAGGLGKLHHTSKFPSRSSIHGKHGNFLASLATLSLLSITSRHQSRISHNSIIIHNSKVLARHLPSPPELRLVNFDHGTRVAVRDLFGSMPVRVKQRASLTERPALDKEWSKLVREVLAMLLAWPAAVHVSLRNTAAQRELRFRPSDKTDVVYKTSRLLMQASLADSSDINCWVPISASCGSVSVKGCICTNPVASRRSQFISLGIHPIMNEFVTDVLYEEINKVFSNSSFGAIDGDENKRGDSPKLEGFSSRDLRSRKAIERWPMFYLKITIPDFDDADGPDRLESHGRTLTTILDLLKATCYGFLKKHHFRPRKVRLSPDESLFSTSRAVSKSRKPSKKQATSSSSSSRAGSATPTTRSESPFNGWHRVKLGTGTPSSASSKANDAQTKLQEQTPTRRLIGEGGRLLRKPFDEPSPEPKEVSTSIAASKAGVETGSHPVESRMDGDTGVSATQPRKRSNWLQKVMDSWENPVFENVQSSIPFIDDTYLSPAAGRSHGCGPGNTTFSAASMSLSGRISRQALAEATVISQVDRKFILVKLPLNDSTPKDPAPGKQSSALIMLDQHAVDERCRLEDLMAGYFVQNESTNQILAATELLERPLAFEVPREEHSLLDQHRDRFAAWGITYQTPSPRSPSQPRKVVITALPPSIMERCRLEPRLLIELLRTEVWRSVDNGTPLSKPSDSDRDRSWVSRFHGCPRGILEMLHSRACRSAIMFNDILSVEECEQLISRLSRCVFPFQCAHGRPSMAPLVDLGAGAKFGGWRETERQERVQWKSWIEES
ncbi:hypothetical protein ACHAPT_006988 [Fusarium lateritium]